MVFGIHKAFRKKKDTVIPGVTGYQGGSIYSPITGNTYSSDARAERLQSGLTTFPTLQDSNVVHNAPSYLQPTLERYRLREHENPQLKNHYSNEDVRKKDADILLLSQAVKEMTQTLQEAEKTAPHLVEVNKPLLDAFEKAQNYAMREGFSMDQDAVDDRLAKYGYQDSSSKIGAMVGLAQKRVNTYINGELQKAKLADELKTSHVDNLRKDIDTIGNLQGKFDSGKQTMLDTIMKTDKQQADNINQHNLQNIQNTNLLNEQSSKNAHNQNILRQKDSSEKTQTEINNEKLKLMKNDLFSRVDNEMYTNLLRAKKLQDANYRPEQRIKNGYPGGFGAKLARGVVKVGSQALGQYLGGPLGAKLGQGMTNNIPW